MILVPDGSSNPPPSHDVAFERLARFLARKDVDPAPRGKGISIGAGISDKEDSTIFYLKVEIRIINQKLIENDVFIGNIDVIVSELEMENIQKSKQISDLQLNLGALSARYFDQKNKLISEFGDKFKTLVAEPNAAGSSHCAHSQAAQDPPIDQPI
ncbi:unnamed protein product [Lactuca saligna]|uniref:Uncharacterized protein n=1 Tax=Lactuca saligna TaxID=75948 RepID=A0AA35ZUH1_LACSI|nr:unnamed protein product [Lactuca saligna]